MTDRVRVGVIGCGRIAQVAHLPAIVKADGVELVGVSDPSRMLVESVARQYGVTAYSETDALLDEDIDAVVIAVPDRLHLPLGLLALQAGKHVLLEKPAASDSDQAEQLTRAAAAADRKLQIGAMRRHDPGMRYAATAIGQLGQLMTVSLWYRIQGKLRAPTEAALFPPTAVDDDVRRGEASHKADRRRYLLATHGAHVFDTMRMLVGEPSIVHAHVAQVGSDFSWHGNARIGGGALCGFELSANVHSEYAEGIEVYGERGHVRVRSYFPFYRRTSEVRYFDEESGEAREPEFGATDPYQRQVEAFARAIVDGTPTTPSGEDGVAALRIIEAVATSAARNGQGVPL
ncbi:MAG TPA: Gfo/Idh/MocA family oxidoreductase [Micromonosporaceae bacterium]|nr:Gfo/Idh/MocA family oxidoreductase [Micromonosporaceae bacterium]